MTDCRPLPPHVRRGLLAAAAVCALGGPVAAAPMPTREYPPTYSSRKAPWYDPFRLFTASATTELPPGFQTAPIPNEAVAPGARPAPAWKWYGYGTPTPGRNPLAPDGKYPAVPPAWHQTTGSTPGAIPGDASGAPPVPPGVLVPDPAPLSKPVPGAASSIAIEAPPGPAVPVPADPINPVPAETVNWRSAPASLRLPTPAARTEPDAPPARLSAPVPSEATHPSVPIVPPRTPLQREIAPANTPDLPVEAAPGIVPPRARPVAMADRPLTARGLAPSPDLLAAAIRRACGSEVRVMEVAAVGPKRIVVRLSGTFAAAWAARDRLARLAELREYRVDFDLVTPVRP